MSNTRVSIVNNDFYINGVKTYSELKDSNVDSHGLLMNARFIQGIFDDKEDVSRFNRFGRKFDPEKNTDELIEVLPLWYNYGLRAFTVGIQGGGTCFTIDAKSINNNPYGENGDCFDEKYQERLDKLIRAADEIGLVVIVSLFYGAQARRLQGGQAILNTVKIVSKFLKEKSYTNVLLEIANEYDNESYKEHPLIKTPEGVVALIELARQETGGLYIGCSGNGNTANEEICKASDFVLIHGNGCSRQMYYNLIMKVKSWVNNKPIVCNEDSQAISHLEIALKTHTSWGYYNNMTKQEPPVNWNITEGEDKYFAHRMAKIIGINQENIKFEDQYYLQGFEKEIVYDGKRWIRIASLYPESINFVDFYIDDKLIYTCYDEPFLLYYDANWLQKSIEIKDLIGVFKAVIHLNNGDVIIKTKKIK